MFFRLGLVSAFLAFAPLGVGCGGIEEEGLTTSEAGRKSAIGTLTVTPSVVSGTLTTANPMTVCASGLPAGSELLVHHPVRNSGSWHFCGQFLVIDATGGDCYTIPNPSCGGATDSITYEPGKYLIDSWYYDTGLTGAETGGATHRVHGPEATFEAL